MESDATVHNVTCRIVAHLPLMRIEPERLSFGDFDLWRMPFATYRSLVGEFFDGIREDYNATAPVFLFFEREIAVTFPEDAPPYTDEARQAEGVEELRSGESAYTCLGWVGLGEAARQIRGFWGALALALPDLLLPDPGLSQIFVVAGEKIRRSSGDYGHQVNVQGPADYEYLCLGGTPHDTFTPTDAPRLIEIMHLAPAIYGSTTLRGTVNAFLEAHSPTLGSPERITLAVISLEELVMPEVTRDLTATFIRRLTGLCSEISPTLARNLYAARSDALHAGQAADFDELALHAMRALSSAICEASKRIDANGTIEALRSELDKPRVTCVEQRRPLPVLPKRSNRLFVKQRTTLFYADGLSLAGNENDAAFWSPLARLETREFIPMGRTRLPLLLVPLNGHEISSLEEKETRRDYASQLAMIAEDRVAGLLIIFANSQQKFLEVNWGNLQQMNGAFDVAARLRDLGTLTLRLAGFAEFWDPEWHGLALFRDHIRTRRPTVFRQSVLMEIHRAVGMADRGQYEMAVVKPPDHEYLQAISGVLDYCLETSPSAMGRSLTLYRRASDPALLPEMTRTRLAFAALESMLGRFGDPERPLSMEELVTRMMGNEAPEAVAWFRQSSRRARNRAAHLAATGEEGVRELGWLLKILRIVTLTYIKAWGEHDPAQPADPREVLIRQLMH